MKVKLGSILTEINGKLGGQYFQASPNGFSLHNRPIINPRAKFNADLAKNTWRKSVSAWKTLTPPQKASWLLFSWNGYTGFSAFVHFNPTALYQGNQLITTAPIVPVIPIAKDLTVLSFSPTHSLTAQIDLLNFSAGWTVIIRISRIYSLSQRPSSPIIRQYYSQGIASPFITTIAGNYSILTHQFPNAQQHFLVKFDLFLPATGFSAPLISAWLPS